MIHSSGGPRLYTPLSRERAIKAGGWLRVAFSDSKARHVFWFTRLGGRAICGYVPPVYGQLTDRGTDGQMHCKRCQAIMDKARLMEKLCKEYGGTSE